MSDNKRPEDLADDALDAAAGGWNLGSATLGTVVRAPSDSRDGYANLEVSHLIKTRTETKG